MSLVRWFVTFKRVAEVLVGEPYVEVEAMKMIMPHQATESGKITQSLSR
jgi:acetyl-CoA carboxylase/biotin carboxylase 1